MPHQAAEMPARRRDRVEITGRVALETVFASEADNLRSLPTNETDGDGPDPDRALRESIAERGVLQPIGVAVDRSLSKPYRYRLVYGFRRFRAALDVGFETVPAVLVTGDAKAQGFANLTENMLRADLAPWELMDALYRLKQAHPDVTSGELAAACGRSSSHVLNLLRLRTKLCPELLEAYREQGSIMHLAHLLTVCARDPEDQTRLYNVLVSGSKGGRPTGARKEPVKNEPVSAKKAKVWLARAKKESKARPSEFLNGVVYALLCVLQRERFDLDAHE